MLLVGGKRRFRTQADGNVHPKYFPIPDDQPATLMIAAAINIAGKDVALRLTYAIYRAAWVEERNLADMDTLISIATECQLDGRALGTS